MSTLGRKFEWYARHYEEIGGFRSYVREVERRFSPAVLQWTTSLIREIVEKLNSNGHNFKVDRNAWSTWWYKETAYDVDTELGRYFHLYVPDGIDWLDPRNEDHCYIGFTANFGNKPEGRARAKLFGKAAREVVRQLPAGTARQGALDGGSIDVFRLDLVECLNPETLSSSEEAAKRFKSVVQDFTLAIVPAIDLRLERFEPPRRR